MKSKSRFTNTDYVNNKWGGLEKASSPELVASMKELYKIYDSSVIDWFVSLYDPKVGGFYFSESGRDGDGFLPDIESTIQALGYINASGMVEETGGKSYADFIPETMKKTVIRFTKSLQDNTDGYFYHKQWGKNIIPSRQARDIMWSVAVLRTLGSAPTYDTPNGYTGDGIRYDGVAVDPHIFDKQNKVLSEKKMTENVIDGKIENAESFLKYLNEKFGEEGSFPLRRYSYPALNELTAMGSVIAARDRLLISRGEKGLISVLAEWLAERQNEFGHWQYKFDENGKFLLDENGNYIPENNYYAANGLLKAVTLYETINVKMPRTAAAAETAIKAISSDEPLDGITSIYNTWFSLNCIKRNLLKHGGKEGEKEYEVLKKRLIELAPEAIISTRDKLLPCKLPDGSFAYTYSHVSYGKSQEATVAVQGTKEGEVNSTRISLSTLTDLYGALGLSEHFVPIYSPKDAERYRQLLIKKEESYAENK